MVLTDSEVEFDDEDEVKKMEEFYKKAHNEKKILTAADRLKKSLGRDRDDVFSDEEKGEPDKIPRRRREEGASEEKASRMEQDKNPRKKREERGSSGSHYAANKASLNKRLRRNSSARLSSSTEDRKGGTRNGGPKPSAVFPPSDWPSGMTRETVDMLTICQYQVSRHGQICKVKN